MEDIKKWVIQNGGVIDGVDVKTFDGYGRGLCANKEFKKDEIIMSIPYSIQINRINLNHIWPEVKLPKFNEGDDDRDDLNGLVYLYLAVNKTNPKCFHWPYINVLPETYDCPLSYTIDELNLMKGTKLYAAVEKINAFLMKVVDYYNNKLIQQFPQYFQPFDDLFKRLQWAHQSFWSRAFLVIYPQPFGEVGSLIPFCDFSNHCTQAKVTYISNTQTETFSFQTNEALVKPGEQIFNNYRIRSNEKLLLGYGFVEENNPCDNLLLRIYFEVDDNQYNEIEEILKQEEIKSFDFFLKLDEDIPLELMRILRIVNLSIIESNQYFQGNINLNYVSDRNELAALRQLNRQLYHLLHLMEFKKEDFDCIHSSSINYHQKCALIYKKGIVDIIEHSMKLCQNATKRIRDQITSKDLKYETISCYDFLFENFCDNLNAWASQIHLFHPNIQYINENHHIVLKNISNKTLHSGEILISIPEHYILTSEIIKKENPKINQPSFILQCIEYLLSEDAQKRFPFIPLILKYIEAMTFYSNDFSEFEDVYFFDEINCVEDDGIQNYQAFMMNSNTNISLPCFVGLFNFVDSHIITTSFGEFYNPLPILPKHNSYTCLEKEMKDSQIKLYNFNEIYPGEEICDNYQDDSSINQMIHFLSLSKEYLSLDYFDAKVFISNESAQPLYEELCVLNQLPTEIFLTQDQIRFDVFEKYIAIYSMSVNKVKLELKNKNTSIEGNRNKTIQYLHSELEVLQDFLPLVNEKISNAQEQNQINRIKQFKLIDMHLNEQINIVQNALKHLEIKN
ncbi:hypothetical protein ENUP19_0248G0098 [Entamoeba nuttalli]|uniref:[Ribulose-bisphosphate-carboxylase]-lysine N-methyltransferase n=2 Tax=Entamoeba nuttalli TaxID=412467 RepID=K2GRJ1_ENTNP|nr:[Ribulose-bisphosphate-carboxylase]-lysine N-methyltransferase [Entamoeba nuttalli P19]EKE37568.1 [Ribulose-bisphosphate-carboxylase]-lysine N-methyltransferase [Entamoeba nuttalli P19]|eukprot:XP_008860094.1 [Ribulose-bisphosphate-carboxylase]-lysine N-methyltransferase [Entamoeba nuttalli P19]